MNEKLEKLIARKIKAESLPLGVRNKFMDEYIKVCDEIALEYAKEKERPPGDEFLPEQMEYLLQEATKEAALHYPVMAQNFIEKLNEFHEKFPAYEKERLIYQEEINAAFKSMNVEWCIRSIQKYREYLIEFGKNLAEYYHTGLRVISKIETDQMILPDLWEGDRRQL